MKVLIYSSVRLFSQSLATSLESKENIEQVNVCYEVANLMPDVKKTCADIVLVDMLNPQALLEVRHFTERYPNIRLLALGIPETPNQVIACADAGFVGYVPISASIEMLCSSMQLALEGACYCHPTVAASLMKEVGRRRVQSHPLQADELTERESQVLAFAGRGLTNKEIARELNLSAATIKNHLHNVFSKLGVHNRKEALVRIKQSYTGSYI